MALLVLVQAVRAASTVAATGVIVLIELVEEEVEVRRTCARCRALSRTVSPRGWWSPRAVAAVAAVVVVPGAMRARQVAPAAPEEAVPARSRLAVQVGHMAQVVLTEALAALAWVAQVPPAAVVAVARAALWSMAPSSRHLCSPSPPTPRRSS